MGRIFKAKAGDRISDIPVDDACCSARFTPVHATFCSELPCHRSLLLPLRHDLRIYWICRPPSPISLNPVQAAAVYLTSCVRLLSLADGARTSSADGSYGLEAIPAPDAGTACACSRSASPILAAESAASLAAHPGARTTTSHVCACRPTAASWLWRLGPYQLSRGRTYAHVEGGSRRAKSSAGDEHARSGVAYQGGHIVRRRFVILWHLEA